MAKLKLFTPHRVGDEFVVKNGHGIKATYFAKDNSITLWDINKVKAYPTANACDIAIYAYYNKFVPVRALVRQFKVPPKKREYLFDIGDVVMLKDAEGLKENDYKVWRDYYAEGKPYNHLCGVPMKIRTILTDASLNFCYITMIGDRQAPCSFSDGELMSVPKAK